MTSIQKLAQLHMEKRGTQRFLYKEFSSTVTVVQLNEKGTFMGSGDLNKDAARALWIGLVNTGWSTKRMAA